MKSLLSKLSFALIVVTLVATTPLQIGIALEDVSSNGLSVDAFAPSSTFLVVTKTEDTADGVCDADCSLREAITAATPGDTVTFALTLAGQSIALASTIMLDKDITIDGSNLYPHVQISGDTDGNGVGEPLRGNCGSGGQE